MHNQYANQILYMCNFLSKGWEASALLLLAFVQKRYDLPLYMVGILSAVFIVSQITISFFAGKIAHTLRSRNVVFLSIISNGLSWLTLSLSGSVPLLYLAFIFGGISSGLFEPIGNSLVAKLATSSNRGTAIGTFAAFGDMGRVVVLTATSALVAAIGLNQACAVIFCSAMVALVMAMVTISKAADVEVGESQEAPVSYANLAKNKKYCIATVAGLADSFSSSSLYIFLPFLLQAKGISLNNTLYLNVIFFGGYMSGRLLLGRLADKLGSPNVLMLCKSAMAVMLLILALVSGKIVIVITLFLLGAFTRGSSPVIRAMVADSMDEKTSFHDAFGVYSCVSRSASAVSRPVFGFLASFAGIQAVFHLASLVSLATLYPAARYKKEDMSETAREAESDELEEVEPA